ncbi:hypothetical protein QF027_009617 [Streptomyces canus]|nr:hypothetical protein [Streptomyces canus]
MAPVNRCQSPTSTARPKAVSVLTPRKHPSRPTTGANAEEAAICSMAPSSRPRRAWVLSTVSKASSKASCTPSRSKESERSQPSCSCVQAVPCHTRPWRSSSAESRCRARIRSPRTSSRARTRSRAASCSSRTGRSASLRPVLTRSPGGPSTLARATTTHRTPAAVNACQPEPGRSGLIRHRHRTRQRRHPGHHRARLRRQPQRPDLPQNPIDRGPDDRPDMNIQPGIHTLEHDRHLPQLRLHRHAGWRQPTPTRERGAGSPHGLGVLITSVVDTCGA